VRFRLDRLAALQRIASRFCLFGDRALFVTSWHHPECTLDDVSAALAVRGLAKRYGAVEALSGVSLEVGESELVGLLGPNGAGKSTLVKIACGLVRPTTGHAEVCGVRAGSREARAAMGYLAELFRFPGWMSADELLQLHQRLAGSEGGERERSELLELVGLQDARGRSVEAMSKGMQQRLGIAQALVGSPRLLLLDEPTSALDPVGRRTVRTLLEELKRRGVSVLLNSHLLSEIELVCDRVVILLGGKVVAAGSPAELARPRGVEIETNGGARTYADASRDDIPRMVAELVRGGQNVYGARVLTSTLEEVYVEAVGGETS
jgi:ABC-2 type transport system ATP-binding protein